MTLNSHDAEIALSDSLERIRLFPRDVRRDAIDFFADCPDTGSFAIGNKLVLCQGNDGMDSNRQLQICQRQLQNKETHKQTKPSVFWR